MSILKPYMNITYSNISEANLTGRTFSIASNASQIQVHMKEGKEQILLKNLVLDGMKDG